MTYKLTLAVFWVIFWVALWPEALFQWNMNWLYPNTATEGCPVRPFWADFAVAIMIEIELTIVHQLFFTALLYVDFFIIQDKYGFLKITLGDFLLRFLLITPLIEIIRVGAMTLITLTFFNWEITYKDSNDIANHARAIGIEPDGSLLVYQSGSEICLTSAKEIGLLAI